MKYSKIDLSNWKRKEHFQIFNSIGQCTFSQTVQLDITGLLEYANINGYKFYPVMIHLISKVVNRFAEFKMAMKGENLVVWDEVHPSYTVFHRDTETFSSLWSRYESDFKDFLSEYNKDTEKYSGDESYFPKEFVENIFYISANPWVSFTSFDFNFANVNNLFAPLFTIGKYYARDEKILLPLAVQVHHAVCDGYHVGRLINEIQKSCDDVNANL